MKTRALVKTVHMEELDPQVSPYLAHPAIAPSLHMHVGTEESKIKFDVEKKKI